MRVLTKDVSWALARVCGTVVFGSRALITLITKIRLLSESQKLWRITETGDLIGVHQVKRNSGASTLVSSVPANVNFVGPKRLKTNIEVPSIEAGKSGLYFLPDRVLVRDTKRFSHIHYGDLHVLHGQKRFVENSSPPSDALQVDTTWRYVNLNGTPDRRFNNNRQLPVMLYGRLKLSTASGLSWIIQVSRHTVVEPVAEAVRSAPNIPAGN